MWAHVKDPLCQLKGSHYKTTDGQIRLHDALATDDLAKRARELDKARQSLLEGIVKQKQYKSSIAWYTLAQVYLYQVTWPALTLRSSAPWRFRPSAPSRSRRSATRSRPR
ncbi:MAG: hypothetical protein ACREL3_01690 [Gemmatimonadales bacterium]